MEHTYINFAIICIAVTAGIFITVIKACDWLISLKYVSKDVCSQKRHEWEHCLKEDFASKETVSHLKEDMEEIKDQNNQILNILTNRGKNV